MAYIYKITNNINGKVYIGQTSISIYERFSQHKRDATKKKNENRPLYSAIKKYGIDSFSIELVEETDNPLEREKFWIHYFDSFKNGYNATIGGDGTTHINYELVVSEYQKLKNQNEVARKLNIYPETVRKILKVYGVERLSQKQAVKNTIGKSVNQYDLQGNFIERFSSIKEAAQSIGKITDTSLGAVAHISDACKGKRKTAYGYKWKFADDNLGG